MSTVLVAGAFGFLGSHICRYLSKNHKVIAVGRGSSRSLLFKSMVGENVKAYEMHLPDPELDMIIREQKPDTVVHCASPASVPRSMEHPHSDFNQSVGTASFVLDSIRRNSPETRFVLMSSASVYGNPAILPIDVNAPVNPVSPYGFHKYMCENLCREYQTIYGVETTILRLFSGYGEGLRKQVVWDIFRKVMDDFHAEIELWGTGEETRDFLYASDIAKAVELIVEKKTTGVFNLASGHETTIAELAEMIVDVCGSNKKIVFNGKVRRGDPFNWRASISLLKGLGFEQEVELKEGLENVYKWISKYENLH